MKYSFKTIYLIFAFILCLAYNVPAVSDDYIQGYADALLENQFHIKPGAVRVEKGIITISVRDIDDLVKIQIIQTLSDIGGVKLVEFADPKPEDIDTVTLTEPDTQEQRDKKETSEERISRFIERRLFEPLIADPRWPHFSFAYQYYIDDAELKNVGSTSFGETLPFYQGETAFGGTWQIGIQAAVFAIFDLDAPSHDLVNADYLVGIPVTYRKESFSAFIRLYHQSSHLGDEFLLRNRTDRVNLSYEAVDFKASYYPAGWLRLYGGAGYILRKDPDDLKRWSFQYGVELRSTKAFWKSYLKPVAGADFKSREESDWDIDVSLRAGMEIESEIIYWNRLHLMLEYFNGYSPHGQFYERAIEYTGLGLHFYF